MDFDFAKVMVIAVFVTGVIWAVDLALWRPKRIAVAGGLKDSGVDPKKIEDALREPVIVEYARSFFPVILVVLILRSFLVEPFRIPSGSMMPTLVEGDFILVNKYAYGIRLPVLNTKVIEVGEPQRGDVAVFRYPGDPSTDYIKRVIGLPGDTITVYGKQVYVNGELAKQKNMGTYTAAGTALHMAGANRRKEMLGDVEHDILIASDPARGEGEFVVPDGHYFMMGDNRDRSNDSRFWGYVPEDHLVGRAFMIWMNWDRVQKRVSWERIGDTIQ